MGWSRAGIQINCLCCCAHHVRARRLFVSYLISLFGKIARALWNFCSVNRASSALSATNLRVLRSSLHNEHSFSSTKVNDGGSPVDARCNNSWHSADLHKSRPPVKEPGTDVGHPCRNACVSSVRLPRRNWSCTSRSHASSQRTHSSSSVTPCTDSSGLSLQPHISACPCAVVADGLYFLACRM